MMWRRPPPRLTAAKAGIFLFVLFYLSSGAVSHRSKRYATDCTVEGLKNLAAGPNMTDKFEIPPGAVVAADGKLPIRCKDGKLIDTTALNATQLTVYDAATKSLFVTCTNNKWVLAAGAWPMPDAACIAAPACTIVNGTEGMPAHISISSPTGGGVTEVTSGNFLTFGCSDSAKILQIASMPYRKRCFNGTFEAASKGAWPADTACVTPNAPPTGVCPQSQLGTLGAPNYLATTTSADMQHGQEVYYKCTSGRRLKGDVDNHVVAVCNDGALAGPPTWPSETDCIAECPTLSVPAGSNFTAINYTMPLDQGEKLTLTCPNDTYVNLDWASSTYDIVCGSYGDFIYPNPFPSCQARPLCPNHTTIELPPASRLGRPPANNTYAASEYIEFFCANRSLIMTVGPSVKVQCVEDPKDPGNGTYKFPEQWGWRTMQCRDPQPCIQDFPTPAAFSGLIVDPNAGVVNEWAQVSYKCEAADKFVYSGGVKVPDNVFNVTCRPPGYWDHGFTWGYCEKQIQQCGTNAADFPEVPKDASNNPMPISLVPSMGKVVNRGGKIYYKCDDDSMMTNLGQYAEVMCEKDHAADTVFFKKPAGWTHMKCIPKVYPSFKEETCICLGDPILSAEQSLQILKLANCRMRHRISSTSRVVPLKDRCGVKSLDNISPANSCNCSETYTDKDGMVHHHGVDFSIWSLGQVTTYDWHPNFSEPATDLFRRFQEEVQTELDKLIYRNNPKPNSWRFIQTVAFTFMPGNPKACSANAIPYPEKGKSDLQLIEKTHKEFGQHIEYKCSKPGQNTNDGLTYKLRCRTDGRFQNKLWLPCRPRKLCVKPPPRPATGSGLDFSNSSQVEEFDYAVYACKQKGFVVPHTPDGLFRTICQKGANFKQTIAIKWPTCVQKPPGNEICENLPGNITGYVKTTDEVLYLNLGERITYRCADKAKLINDSYTKSFFCGYPGPGQNATLLGWDNGAGLPACHVASKCAPANLPTPGNGSGIEMPIRTADIIETDFIEYMCEKPGWALKGDYRVPDEFSGNGVKIVGGRMRMYCLKNGQLGTVTKWPQCRDSAITQCTDYLNVTAFGLAPSKGDANAVPIPVAGTYTLACSPDATKVTNNFKTLDIKCDYNGQFIKPEDNFTECRAANSCTVSPVPPSDTLLKKADATVTPIKEFMPQLYDCQAGYTLSGVVHEGVSNGYYSLPCVISNNNWTLPTSWPKCLPVKQTCNVAPILPGFVSSDKVPVNVGQKIYFACNDGTQVTDLGAKLEYTCTDSGEFTVIDPLPTCRSPKTCEAAPVPNRNITRLLPTHSTNVMEYQTAKYKCQEGSALIPASIGNAAGELEIQCGYDGKYPETPAWVICTITHCLDSVNKTGYTISSSAPVPVNGTVNYTCSTAGMIAGNQTGPVSVLCQENGTLAYPDPFPTCRSLKNCNPVLPAPPASSFLLPSTSTGLKEFSYAEYSCKDGATLSTLAADPSIVNNRFRTMCHVGGVWNDTANIPWPTCNVTHCTQIPTIAGFTALTSGEIAVGTKASYKCQTPGFVLDPIGVLQRTCNDSGFVPTNYDSGTDGTCRAANVCPSPPTPPGTSFLLASTSNNVPEYSYAEYNCKPGSEYVNPTDPNVVNGKYRVQCQQHNATAATWPAAASITWPACTVLHCVPPYPTVTGFTANSTGNIEKGASAKFQCGNQGQVVENTGLFLDVGCNNDGTWSIPSPLPNCKVPAVCPNPPPTPFADSYLLQSISVNVTEFNKAKYMCKAGSRPLNTSDGNFYLECGANGAWPTMADANWTVCQVDYCSAYPNASLVPSLTSTDRLPIQVGKEIAYRCIQASEVVVGHGVEVKFPCAAGGIFTIPNPAPGCRARGACSGARPAPSAASNLDANSDTTDVSEFDYVEYSCKEGYSLWPVRATSSNNVMSNKFKLQCPDGAAWPATGSVTWPTCVKKDCDVLPTPAGFTAVTPAPIAFGDYAIFKCDTAGKVTDLGPEVAIKCNGDNTFAEPATWPTCRDPVYQAIKPAPPASQNFLPVSNSTVVIEYQHAIYKCMPGKYFGNMETEFKLMLNKDGVYNPPDYTPWPKCTKPACDGFTPPAGWKASIAQPKEGDQITFTCANSSLVANIGKSFTATCSDGTVTLPAANLLTCRLPNDCTDTPPTPASGSNLLNTASTVTKEYGEALYVCQSGHQLSKADANSADGVNFALTCGSNGKFPTSVTWPTCQKTCTSDVLPDAASMLVPRLTPTSIRYQEKQDFKCSSDLYNLPSGDRFFNGVKCIENGALSVEDPWPTCQAMIKCPYAPVPTAGTFWEMLSTVPVEEYDKAYFRCKSGYEYYAPHGTKVPEGFNNLTRMFELPCQSDGTFLIYDSVRYGWPQCTAVQGSSRRRRYIEYPQVQDDIDYAVVVLFEAQFRYTDAIESEMVAKYNYSKGHANFSRALVQEFHKDFRAMLGDGRIKHGFHLGTNPQFTPSCEQPTAAALYESEQECTRSGVQAACSRNLLGSAWLGQMGYANYIQPPKWSNTAVIPYDPPVGTHIEFYCSAGVGNVLLRAGDQDTVLYGKRPRKDIWDRDNEDGVISAICAHGGALDISSNPADWDRCRSRCPAAKPEPPIKIGAQLIGYDSPEKWDRGHWEDESVTYGCENQSLVINSVKGLRTKSYSCQADSAYNTPTGGKPWPACTLNPTDPYILTAIKLLTDEYDRNIVYREKLKTGGIFGFGANSIEALLFTYAIPFAISLLCFIFLVMCCSRANSPICRIFEPKS